MDSLSNHLKARRCCASTTVLRRFPSSTERSGAQCCSSQLSIAGVAHFLFRLRILMSAPGILRARPPQVVEPAVYDPHSGRSEQVRNHIPGLDGVRGLAILAVMIFHIFESNHIYKARGVISGKLLSIALYGWSGVDLFFVLSGFLITGILIRSRNEEHYFANFYTRRALRIFPLYYATLFVLFAVVPLFPALYTDGLRVAHEHQRWYWSYLTNIPLSRGQFDVIPWPTTHLWSLAIEEQFYLVWPAVVLLTRNNRRLASVCLLGIAASVTYCAWAVYLGTHPAGAYFSTLARSIALFSGALLAIRFADRKSTPSVARVGEWIIGIGFCSIVLLRYAQGVSSAVEHFMLVFSYVLNAAVAIGILLTAIATESSRMLARVWKSRLLRFFGRYSYALYVFHILVVSALNQVFRLRPHDATQDVSSLSVARLASWSAIYFTITIAAALVSWNLLEHPFLRLKGKLTFSRRAHVPPVFS